MRSLLPILLLVAAVGLFVGYTNKAFQATKTIAAQTAAYEQALSTSKQLRAKRDELLSKRDTFSAEQVQKLERMLPDNVDNIRLIIDINNIAARHALTLKNVSLGSVSSASGARSAAAIGASGDAIGSVELGFTLASSFDNFLAFLTDLEHSLRVVDMEKLSFKYSGPADMTDFSMTIRTYWLH